MKKNNRTFKIVMGTTVALIVSLILMLFIDIRMMNQNKEVVFSTWGFNYAPAVDLHEVRIEIETVIKEYLIEKGDNEPKHHDDEKTFVSMKIYLLEEVKGDELYYIYAWVRDGKYYLENDELKQDSASSIPYKFVVEKINDEFIVTDSRTPRDGSYYDDDMKNIFPRSVRKDMENVHTDGTTKRLDLEVEEQAKLYFHK